MHTKKKEKAAVAPLDQLKAEVIGALEKYTNRFKLSLLGHHHDERARAVIKAIKQSDSADKIEEILNIQAGLMVNEEILPTHDLNLDARWNKTPKHLKKKGENKSGFLKAIENAQGRVASFKEPPREDLHHGHSNPI